MKDFVFSVFTNKHKSCLMYSSKRDAQTNISMLFKNQITRSLLITALCGRVD